MWRVLAALALMVASAIATFAVTVLVLIDQGLRRHGNYEYYGNYPALLLGPALVSFVASGVIVWHLHKKGRPIGKILGTLALMAAGGFAAFTLTTFISMPFGLWLHDDAYFYCGYPPLLLGPAAIGFLAPGVVVWHLHRRGTEREQPQ